MDIELCFYFDIKQTCKIHSFNAGYRQLYWASWACSGLLKKKKTSYISHWVWHLLYISMYDLFQVQFSSVVPQSCPTHCDPMNPSTSVLPVHHQLPEFTQTHVHRVGDAIQHSHPLLSPSPPAPNPSQHQSLFQEEKATFCMRHPKYWSFSFSISPSKLTPRTDLL